MDGLNELSLLLVLGRFSQAGWVDQRKKFSLVIPSDVSRVGPLGYWSGAHR